MASQFNKHCETLRKHSDHHRNDSSTLKIIVGISIDHMEAAEYSYEDILEMLERVHASISIASSKQLFREIAETLLKEKFGVDQQL